MSSGKIFEESVESSANKLNIFNFRVRDVNPMAIKPSKKWMIPKNKFDYIYYYKDHLFPAELKSTKAKSISFSESMIKSFQIKSLTEASKYEGVIPIFIFNFREPTNRTFAVHINDFNKYKHIAENQLDHNYKCRKGKKLNRASIPIDICEEIGVELKSTLKRTRYHYHLDKLFEELINKFG